MAHFCLFRKIDELLTMTPLAAKDGRRPQEVDLGLVEEGAVLIENGHIRWAGQEKELSSHLIKSLVGKSSLEEVSGQGKTLIPALVESHTHLVFAGSRAHEFEMRVKGATYQEIAEAGGGIRSTVKHTREADEKTLFNLAKERVDEFARQGVGTLEIKSGYGLDTETELKMLRVAGKLKGPRILRTFLGPHAVGPEFSSSEEYLKEVTEKMLPAVSKEELASRVDIFVEQGYFTLEQGEAYYNRAQSMGYALTGHMEQMNRTGGAVMAARLGAQSVDHLVQVTPEDIEALAKSHTTCVLLPTADLYLRMAYPPARQLIDAGARVALATDFNPGSAPSQDLSLVGVLARLEMRMTLPEVLAAYTYNGAAALGLQDQCGSIEAEKSADLALIEGSWRDLFYQVGHHPVVETWAKGKRIHQK